MKRKRAHETKEIGHDSKTEPLHLSDLQRDLHCVVFSYASLEDRLAIRLVCKSWHQWSSLQLSWAPNLSLGDKYLPAKKLRSLATSLRGKRFTQVEFNLVPKQYRLLLEKICGNLKTLELTIVHVDGSLRLLNSLRHRDEIKSLSLYTSLTGNENPYLEMKSLTDLRAWMFFQSGMYALFVHVTAVHQCDFRCQSSIRCTLPLTASLVFRGRACFHRQLESACYAAVYPLPHALQR